MKSKDMKNIRCSAKAIIIKGNKVLMTKNIDPWGYWYLLPGGGQNHGETLIQALKRECKEEVNVDLRVGKLLLIREYIGAHHEFKKWDKGAHQVEFMFLCEIIGRKSVKKGKTPDTYQKGVVWLDIRKLDNYRIYPRILKDIIPHLTTKKFPVYLGDVN
jgi:ADP-ribose pyrophosphatase YjhB (NUDIX family)